MSFSSLVFVALLVATAQAIWVRGKSVTNFKRGNKVIFDKGYRSGTVVGITGDSRRVLVSSGRSAKPYALTPGELMYWYDPRTEALNRVDRNRRATRAPRSQAYAAACAAAAKSE